jgi:hypothetical protein
MQNKASQTLVCTHIIRDLINIQVLIPDLLRAWDSDIPSGILPFLFPCGSDASALSSKNIEM